MFVTGDRGITRDWLGMALVCVYIYSSVPMVIM